MVAAGGGSLLLQLCSENASPGYGELERAGESTSGTFRFQGGTTSEPPGSAQTEAQLRSRVCVLT